VTGQSDSRKQRELRAQLLRVESVLSSVNRGLMARAALKCKSYTLSLVNFEQQIQDMRERKSAQDAEFEEYYESLHEIYAALDEPDGMEGISVLISTPSLEHQIRQHESTGRWTSAQSCWEVCLQREPDNLNHHVGLLRCLRNLGHYGQSSVQSSMT
jgi:serine/threonine-protein kinase ATR